jgi:predicted glycosyltransferase
MVPDAIPPAAMRRAGAAERKLFRFPGLKEDYYLADFEPDSSVLEELGVDRGRVLVVVRPPPENSAYHAPNAIYSEVIARLVATEGVVVVVIPRTDGQRRELSRHPAIVVPERAIDGQSLTAYADLVVGAGGTMNREAVALGTPVWTMFSGRMGAVDEALIASGALNVLTGYEDLALVKRAAPVGVRNPRDPGLLAQAALAVVAAT